VIIYTLTTGFASQAAAELGEQQIINIVWDPALGTVTYTFKIIFEPAISNICFPAGTPITTDQSPIPIEDLQSQVHTIHGQVIQHITQTRTLDPYLICFEKHALGRHVPNQRTLMSKDHKIEFNGQLVSAERFLHYSPEVKKVKYTGEILYNVLLATYETMHVNNLVCETLHPNNFIAKLYTTNLNEEYKSNMIRLMNHSILTKDYSTYKKIVTQLL